MSDIATTFINAIVERLDTENDYLIDNDETPLDIPFMISALEQNISQFKDLLHDIELHSYIVCSYEPDTTNGYTNGRVIVSLYDEKDRAASFYYEIEFWYNLDWQGYCECKPDMDGYDSIQQCCGEHCDWNRPSIYVRKVSSFGEWEWQGLQKDYWRYAEEFIKRYVTSAEVTERQLQAEKINAIQKEIEKLQKRLDILQNGGCH